ncbi:hypothetical protein MTAT_30110 [Moorella thermoacetica]|uniref:Uncharacterized protein n=1 Tax=Neomoorella thermoacetica TaxID=1525 RepID=A0ABY3N2P9_NEOTH|nr:hypothetical protein MTAT_30110 [Moorella thermoacetica]
MHRLLQLFYQVLDIGGGHPADVPVVGDGVADLKQANPQPVTAVEGRLLDIAKITHG